MPGFRSGRAVTAQGPEEVCGVVSWCVRASVQPSPAHRHVSQTLLTTAGPARRPACTILMQPSGARVLLAALVGSASFAADGIELAGFASLFLGRPPVLGEQSRGLSGCRDLANPVGKRSLPVPELVHGSPGLSPPRRGQDRQLVVFTDHQVPEKPSSSFQPTSIRARSIFSIGRCNNPSNTEKRRERSEL